MKLTIMLTLLGLLCILTSACAQDTSPTLKLSAPVVKLWDKGGHNAFTDLTRYKDKFYCVFRDGAGHASGAGNIRVLVSADGKDWQTAALLSKEDTDLRDPHLSHTPDGKLMINGGAAYPQKRNPLTGHYSFVSFSEDGKTWTEPRKVLDDWQWLWQVTWHKGTAYGVAYQWDPKDKSRKYSGVLYKSKDGLDWQKVTDLAIPNTTEATIRFADDTMLILQRRDGSPNTAQLGVATAPYDKITWHDLGVYYGGPNLLQDPQGHWWTAGRLRKGESKTVLGRLDIDNGKLHPLLTLPSGGDTSYPGLTWHEGQLWVSYYSSHEGRTSVYLARVDVK